MSAGLIPQRAAIAIADLLDNCARVQAGQHVLLLGAQDGLHGGRNLVDEQAISWIQIGIQQRGGHATVMWADMPLHPDVYWSRGSDEVPSWSIPPTVKAAIDSADLVIGHLVDLWTEGELKDSRTPNFLYNMATTAPLLASSWCLTPWELVAEIRVRAAAMVSPGAPWTITHPNGTEVRGTVGQLGPRYGTLRHGPFPEGVFPSLPTHGAEGVLVFETTGPHWARHVGLPGEFSAPVRVTLEEGKIRNIRGGEEAAILRDFFEALSHHLGDAAYEMRGFHGGAHPHARVSESDCPDPGYRAFVEHHGAHSMHFHLGNSHDAPHYPFNVHMSAELKGATVKIGDNIVYEKGRLTAFDHPEVLKVAARYPGRPGVSPQW